MLNVNPLERLISNVREKAQEATTLTKYMIDMNPTMTVHQICTTKVYVSDYKRETLTQDCLVSHSLEVDVGRRSRTEKFALIDLLTCCPVPREVPCVDIL